MTSPYGRIGPLNAMVPPVLLSTDFRSVFHALIAALFYNNTPHLAFLADASLRAGAPKSISINFLTIKEAFMRISIALLLILTFNRISYGKLFDYQENIANGNFESSTPAKPLADSYKVVTKLDESVSLEIEDSFEGNNALRIKKPFRYRNETTKIVPNGNGEITFRSPLVSPSERLFKCHLAAKLVSKMNVSDESPFFLRIASQRTDGESTILFVRVPYVHGNWSEITQYITVPENTVRLQLTLHIKFATDIIIDDISMTNAYLATGLGRRVYLLDETIVMSHTILNPNNADLSPISASVTIDSVEGELDAKGKFRDISRVLHHEAEVVPRNDGMIHFSPVILDRSLYDVDHMYRVTVNVNGTQLNETRSEFFLITQNNRGPKFYWDLNRNGEKEEVFPVGVYSILPEDAPFLRELGWVDFLRGGRALYKNTRKSDYGMFVYPSFHYFEEFIFDKKIMADSIKRLLNNKDNKWAGGIDIGGEPADDGLTPERSAWAYNLAKRYTPDRPVIQMLHTLEAYERGFLGDAVTLWPNFKRKEGGYSTTNIHKQYVEKMAAIRANTDGRIPVFVFVPANYLARSSESHPSRNDLRCVSALALTLEADGIMFHVDNESYLYPNSSNGELPNFFDDAPGAFDTMMQVGKAVADMKFAMLEPNSEDVSLISGNERYLKFIAKEDENFVFIVVSNYSGEKKNLVFSLGDLTENVLPEADELLTNRQLELTIRNNDYRLKTTIRSKEGHIYRIPKYQIPEGPVAHWNMEQGRELAVNDVSGNGNRATLFGVKFAPPKSGSTALRFDGKNDYVKIPNSPRLGGESGLTISAWIRPDNLENVGYPSILSKSNAYRLYTHSDRRVRFQTYNQKGSKAITISQQHIPDKEWTHIAGTFDGAHLSLYGNGHLQDVVPFSGTIRTNENPVFLGSQNGTRYFFQGKIDDVKIYDRPLSEHEILDLFMEGGLTVTPSVGAVPLRVTADAVGFGRHGEAIDSYLFDFGDGTIVGPQTDPIAHHTYTDIGAFTINVRLITADGSAISTSKSVQATDDTDNVVGNPSFESNTFGWSPYRGAIIRRTAGGIDGAFSLEVEAAVASRERFGINDVPNWVSATLAAGIRYRFTVWVRSDNDIGDVRLRIREYINGVRIGSTSGSIPIPLSPSWQRISADHITRAAGSSLDVQLQNKPVESGEIFEVDKFSIQVIP